MRGEFELENFLVLLFFACLIPGVWAIDYEGLGSVGASPINCLITYLGYQNYFPKIFLDPKMYFRVLIKILQDINLNIHWN